MSVRRTYLLERLPLLRDRPVAACGMAVVLSAVAVLVRVLVNPLLPPGFPFVVFFPAVTISAFLFGRRAGIVSALLCGATSLYFFVAPFASFSIGPGVGVAMLFYATVVTVDITLVHWMQTANGRLLAERERSDRLAARSELLFGELQHRVANNIQMVGAVLALQKRGVTDEGARQALDEAAAKLQLIGRIQRQLYDTAGSRIALDAFLRDLAADLVAAGGKPGITHSVDAADDIRLDPDALIPLALIMAEATANAIEHGFANRDAGHVHIVLDRDGDAVRLRVRDNGAGLPQGFDAARPVSLGLKIATTLARQLGGIFAVCDADGGGVLSELTIHPAAA